MPTIASGIESLGSDILTKMLGVISTHEAPRLLYEVFDKVLEPEFHEKLLAAEVQMGNIIAQQDPPVQAAIQQQRDNIMSFYNPTALPQKITDTANHLL